VTGPVPDPVPHPVPGPVSDRVLVVDAANVVGSRPDGWWRDRAGAAERLLSALAVLVGRDVPAPGAAVRLVGVRVVLEGQAVRARDPEAGEGLVVVRAPGDGDTAVVQAAQQLLAEGAVPLVVTADRGLRQRLPQSAEAAGPGWLNGLLGR
jgi:hypothetical protein